jgi:outer membrane protein assembly factor BamD
MGIKVIVLCILSACWAAACSSVSLRSLPSLPWSNATPQPDPTADALFDEGVRYFNEKKYVRAIDAFVKVKTDHPFSPQVAPAELKIADAYYLNKQYVEAVAAFKEFQSLHPSNENIPFVLYRLGQAHFDQFTATDRDQKNTEIAKSYFESVIANHPKSPYAAEAREKLAKCIEYLAEAEFNVASFYLQQEKYPAARDRFEEIVRRYRGTPTAIKSLFYLGEAYRREKNSVRAALAYEALVHHYPDSPLTREAKIQLSQLEREKHDPLALLLMRDRRPAAAPPEETQEVAASNKLKDLTLVAKKDVVHEQPGDEKGVFRRVADKINPFSSSGDAKKDQDKKREDDDKRQIVRALAEKKKQSTNEESKGILAALWNGINPFAGRNSEEKQHADNNKSNTLVNQVDDSLQQKGIDATAQASALKPPPAELPVEEVSPPRPTNTAALLGEIDSNLEKGGKSAGALPPLPEIAEAFTRPDLVEAAKAAAAPQPAPSSMSSGLLSNIDQKLKSHGVEPSNVALPQVPSAAKDSAPKTEQPKKVELEPKLAIEKGPLYLGSTEIPGQTTPDEDQEQVKKEKQTETAKPQEPSVRGVPQGVLRAPSQAQTASQPTAKPAEKRTPAPGDEEEPKPALEQLREDAEKIRNLLNPFRW